MTAHPETRFHCDRCGTDHVAPTDGSGPPINRMAGPDNWLMLRIGSAPDVAPSHLCHVCSGLFRGFMASQFPRLAEPSDE